MAWNDSGNSGGPSGGSGGGEKPGGNRNPWGKRPQQGPPDLDQWVRNMQRKLAGIFGGGGGNRPTDSSSTGPGGIGIGVVIAALAAFWALTGFYQVDQAERAIILRFGKYTETTQSGLNWRWPRPIEREYIVNIELIDSFTHATRMLTADENIVEIKLDVQFRRTDPKLYKFNVRDPDSTLHDVSESAIRDTIGRSTLEDVLESGRQKIAADTKELIQSTLNFYKVGIEVTSVNLPDVKVPEQVRAAQEDSIKAGKDKERFASAAQTYANGILPIARGDAARAVQDAQAYRSRKIADSEGEAARFTKLLAEYERAPAVTRQRLYLETLETVLSKSKKVVLDTKGSGNMLYLPIDKLIEQRASGREESRDTIAVRPAPAIETPASDDRTRGTR
jgi:modulator of FtsH protease HflK